MADLRRHHHRRGPQRPHPAGLSRQGRAEDALHRAPAGRGRRALDRGRPAPSGLPAQHPRVLPARHHRDAVVRRPRARAARRALHRAGAQRRAADQRRPRARMVDRHRADRRVVRASSAGAMPRRCAAGSTSSCRSCATFSFPRAGPSRCRRKSGAPRWSKSAAGRRLLEVSALSPLEFVHQEFEHPTVKAGLLFFNGLREVDLRVQRLRPSHRGAAREPRQGADVARRIGGARARARSRGARERRRDPADDRAGADRGRERPRRRRRDRRRRAHPRAAVRRLVAQSDADLRRSAGRGARAARDPRAGRALPVQSARAAVRAASQSARAAALRGERRSIPSLRAPSW